jgi:hypothetical protein
MLFIAYLNGQLAQDQKDTKVSKLDALVYMLESSFMCMMKDGGFLKIKHDLCRGLSGQALKIILNSHECLLLFVYHF